MRFSLSAFRLFTALVLSALLCAQGPPIPKVLNLEIVEGDSVINNARQRVAREPIVQVTDENRKPVAGVLVTFSAPSNGPGVTFANGTNSITAVTGPDGRATTTGLKANSLKGEYQIRVSASYQGLTASNVIRMSNLAAAGGLSTAAIWTIVLVAGAGAAAGLAFGLKGGDSTPTAATRPPATATPGIPVIGPPR
jgi:hypothetical protein